MISLSELQKQVHQLAREKGWWPVVKTKAQGERLNLEEVNIPEKLMLMTSELGEALEWYRKQDEEFLPFETPVMYTGNNQEKPDGFWIELADVIIRILDLAGAYGIDMESLIKEKHEYNKTRPFRHGNKKC